MKLPLTSSSAGTFLLLMDFYIHTICGWNLGNNLILLINLKKFLLSTFRRSIIFFRKVGSLAAIYTTSVKLNHLHLFICQHLECAINNSLFELDDNTTAPLLFKTTIRCLSQYIQCFQQQSMLSKKENSAGGPSRVQGQRRGGGSGGESPKEF